MRTYFSHHLLPQLKFMGLLGKMEMRVQRNKTAFFISAHFSTVTRLTWEANYLALCFFIQLHRCSFVSSFKGILTQKFSILFFLL